MTVEYLPVGIACNLKCSYCYQETQRDAGNISAKRDWPRVKAQIERIGVDFVVFGGEPLLAPIEHLEEVWRFGYEKYGKNGIQTNGSLITEAHIDLFKKYGIYVGISIDGPGELNSLRHDHSGSLVGTERTIKAIHRLCEEGIYPSLIVTVHQANGTRLPELTAWLDEMEKLGIRYINLHFLEVEKGMEGLGFTQEMTTDVFLKLYEWSKTSNLHVEPFTDIRKLLTERNPNVSCIWNHCDPSTTNAVQGINPDGSMSNCGRANKDGVNWVKADEAGYERYLLLHKTPQEHGGCKDCTFFIFCKGQCPGTAIDGDWRNRTQDCKTWYALFERIETDLIAEARLPISKDTAFKAEIERDYLASWQGISHGDVAHGDVAHGDKPHGDEHGDHTDYGINRGVPATFLAEKPSWID